jgi:hypothetical protein
MARPATADHLRSRKQPATKTVEVVLDPALAEQVREAERRRDDADRRLAVRPDDPNIQTESWEAAAALETLRAQAVKQDAVVTVRFRSIGRHAWDDLIRQHPPTDAQTAEAKAAGMGDLNFNSDTFPPAVVAASLEDPKLTVDEVAEIWDSPDWNQAELGVLFGAALEVNNSRHTLDLGKDSGGTLATGRRSTGAAKKASPTRSS